MRYIFRDTLAENVVRRSLERLSSCDIAIHDVATWQIVGCTLCIERQIGYGKIVLHAAADLEPFGIHRCHRTNVDKVNLLDELRDFGDRKSTRLNSSHIPLSRMPSSA